MADIANSEATPGLRVVSGMGPGAPVNPANFVGGAWIEALSSLGGNSRLYANIVTFAPGGRTNWHSHTVGQILYVLSGVGRVQCEGGALLELRAGQTANIAAGVFHWHGAWGGAGCGICASGHCRARRKRGDHYLGRGSGRHGLSGNGRLDHFTLPVSRACSPPP